MKKFSLFILLYILLNLHLFRNISVFGYLALLSSVYIPVMLYCLPRFVNIRLGLVGCWFLIYIVTALWPAIVTFTDYGVSAGIYAVGRYFMTVPIAVAALLFLTYEYDLRKMLWIFCLIVLIGLLTIPLQYVIGPISWFAEPGERAGMIRYGSLLGSLTVAGGVAPYAVFIALTLRSNSFIQIALLIGLCVGAVLTLQKVALLGIPLSVCLYILYSWRQLRQNLRKLLGILVRGLLSVIIAGVLISFLRDSPDWQKAEAYASAVFMLEGNVENTEALGGDITIQESIITRLIDHPQRALFDLYKFQGWAGYVLGGGFGMVGTSMLRPNESPFGTSENGYVDFMLIGGLAHVLAFCGLIYSTLRLQWG